MAPSRQRQMLGKRKSGHIGFQSNEIAFIEDEMAALAQEYGLQVDREVAANVGKRKDHKKKARMRRHEAAPSSSSSSVTSSKTAPSIKESKRAITLVQPARRRVIIRGDFAGDHDLIAKILRNVLPEGVTLGKCDVPGCNCSWGHRETTFNGDNGDEIATESDVIRLGACKKCHHGVLHHTLVEERNSSDVSKPSGGQRLLGALYALIRTGRLAGSLFRSRVWVASILEMLSSLLAHVRKQITGGGSHNGQKTLKELQQEQIVLTELQSLLKKAEKASQKAVSRDELPIEIANALDPMYFRVYYACIVLYGRACAAVPPPEQYFDELESFVPEIYTMTETFVNQELLATSGQEDEEDEVPLTLFKSLAMSVEAQGATSNSKKKKLTSSTNNSSGIALLDIYHARFREGVRLFYENSIGMHGEMDALLTNARGVLSGGSSGSGASGASASSSDNKKKNYRRERAKEEHSSAKDNSTATSSSSSGGVVEMPAYELLTQWRNNCRDWCCHLYAYATPTDDALRVISKYAPIVEVGAGTGYWSGLLHDRGVDVMAFDVAPPSLAIQGSSGDSSSSATKDAFAHLHKKKAKDNEPKTNAYHGEVPTFSSVAKGGPETLRSNAETHARALFLCYPPPHDEMARLCLKFFKGDHVIHVGEWQGDTGDRKFEKELVKKFTIVEEVELPNWGNSAYSLTVWKRKAKSSSLSGGSVVDRLSCFHCHASQLDATCEEEAEEFKRCVLCKTHVYCSEECAQATRRVHAAEHALRLVFLEQEEKLDYVNDLHYKPLEIMTKNSDDEDGEQSEEDDGDKVVVTKTNWNALKATATARGDDQKDKAAKTTTSSTSGGGFAFNFGA